MSPTIFLRPGSHIISDNYFLLGVLSSQLRFIPRAQVPVLDGIVSDVNSDTPILSLEPVISDSSDFELEIQVEDRTLSMRSMSVGMHE